MLGPERPEAVSPARGVVLDDHQPSVDCQQTSLSLSLSLSLSSFSPLYHGLEHQTQPTTHVTPTPLLLSSYPLYRPLILPTPVTQSPTPVN